MLYGADGIDSGAQGSLPVACQMPDLRSLLHVLVTEQRADLMRALQHLNSDFLPLCLFHRADDGVTPWDLAMASHASEVVMAAERYEEALQRPNETEAQMI